MSSKSPPGITDTSSSQDAVSDQAAHPQEKHPTTDVESHLQHVEPDAPSHTLQIRGFKWLLVVISLYSANFLYGMDSSIAANIQAPVAQTIFRHFQARMAWS